MSATLIRDRPTFAGLQPYLGLASFDAERAPIFFGRERDTRLIASNLLAFKLTVLYGPSGVGKSSILQAGVVPEVRARIGPGGRVAPPVVAYINSWRDDPTATIDAEVRREARRVGIAIDPEPDRADSLVERLEAWARDVDGELFLVFDQFEDHFLYHDASSAASAALAEALASDVPHLHVLLSLRDDALSELDRFQADVPNVLDNTYRLNHLDRRGAEAAICGPIDVYNRTTNAHPAWAFEPGLVGRVLDEVRVGGLVMSATGTGQVDTESDGYETTHIQLVMDRLWRAEQVQSDHVIEHSTLDALGGAEGIVRSHLAASLVGLTADERDIAAEAFVHLVTPSGTKIALGSTDLADYCHAGTDEVTGVLEKLAGGDRRILRTVPPAPERPTVERYEIFHDALGGPISEWRHAHEARRAARRGRRRRIVLAIVAALFAGLAASALVLFVQARHEADVAESHRLAAESLDALGTDPVEAGRLAVEAWSHAPTSAAADSARRALGAMNLETSFEGHTGAVTSVAASRDSQTVLTTSLDGTARLWPVTGGVPTILRDGDHPVMKGLFAPDGRTVATLAQDDDTIRLWDVATREVVARLAAADDIGFFDMAYAPDGASLAALRQDGTIEVWDLAAGSARTIGDGTATAIAFVDDGHVIVGTYEGRIDVVDITTGLTEATIDGSTLDYPINFVTSVAGKGDLVAIGDWYSDVWVWEWSRAGSPKQVEFAGSGGQGVRELVFSDDGTHLAAAVDKLGVVVAVKEEDVVAQVLEPKVLRGASDWVHAIAFAPGGSVVTASGDGLGRVYDTATGVQTSELRGHTDAVADVTVASDGRIISASWDYSARMWSPPMTQVLGGASNWLLDVTTDEHDQGDRRVIAASVDGNVYEWSLNSGAVARRYPTGDDPDRPPLLQRLALDSSGRYLAVTDQWGHVWVWDRTSASSEALAQLQTPSYEMVTDLEFGPDGMLIIADAGGTVAEWDVRDPAADRVQLARVDRATVVAVAAESGLMATGGLDGRIDIWDATGHKTIDAESGPLTSLAFSADGRWLASAGGHKARVWDVTSGELRADFEGARSRLSSVTINDAGTMVGTSAADGSVGIGVIDPDADADADPYRLLVKSHDDSANQVVFLSTGELVSVGDDKVVRITACSTCDSDQHVVRALRAHLPG